MIRNHSAGHTIRLFQFIRATGEYALIYPLQWEEMGGGHGQEVEDFDSNQLVSSEGPCSHSPKSAEHIFHASVSQSMTPHCRECGFHDTPQ